MSVKESIRDTSSLIVIAAALPMEVAGIVRSGRFAKERAGNLVYMRGGVHGVDAALFVSGMGGPCAYETAKAACASLSPRAFISVGLSAALDPNLAPGAVAVGTGVRHAGGGEDITCDPGLLGAAHGALDGLPGVYFGALLASDRVAATSGEKRRLAASSGCIALDMESHGAGRAAGEAGVPFIAVRAVSDGLEEDLPVDFNVFTKDGRLDWPRFAIYVITHPGTLLGLMRLGRNSRLAADNLTAALGRLIPSLG